MTRDFPQHVERFLRDHISSVEQLELLLLLFGTAPREWSAVSASRELRIDPVSAARRLADFQSRGLVAARAADEALVYWYDGGAADRVLAELQVLFRERRTSVINVIVSAPSGDIRVFSEAFRVRRTDDQ